MRKLLHRSGNQIRLITVGLIAIISTLPSFAQISSGGTPSSLLVPVSQTVPTISMPSFDVQAYLIEDANTPKDESNRFGVPFNVSLNLNTHGQWTMLANGDRIWRLRILSEDAYSINLLFDDFLMPEGANLFIYNDDHRYTIGAFTSRNNKETGMFSTQPVPGDAITLEYFEPAEVSGEGRLSVYRVVHAYRNMFGYPDALDDFNESGWCNNNVACDEEWDFQERGVVMILTGGGWRYCSGSLINTVNSDGTPYILTANHCDPASNDVAMFNYQSPVCTPNQDGPTNMTVSGGTERFNTSTMSSSDCFLWELSVPVPDEYMPYFNGWNAVDEPSTSSVCIHHPSGDVKKITWDNDPTTTTTYLGTSSPGDGTHWRIATWEDGTTEGGSSGSPLFDQNYRIIGQLHGGYASCSNNVNDYYGKFSLSMTSGLRTWLDPENTGVMAIDGYDPNFAGRVVGTVTGGSPAGPLNGVLIEVIDGTQESVTEADGTYEIRLPEGTFSLRFTRFGYEEHTEENIVIVEEAVITRDVVMTSIPVGTMTGTVLAGMSQPVQNAQVAIADIPDPPVFTDENGQFEFNLPGGDYEMTVTYGDVQKDTTVAIPTNGQINVSLYLESDRTNAESGDAYGYLAHDHFDLGIPPEFDWVEISPSEGGPGTVLPLEAPDYNAYLSLDEPFFFYGQSYDTLTINENGWIAPGYSYHQRNNNTVIPNSNGPDGTLALFWDNLHDGEESEICWWYDDEHCRLIIEYYKMQFLPELDSTLTCQVHIYSAYAWPTPTGDNEFAYLYKHIGVPTSSTVGIENPAQDDGLQILYNGTLGSYSWPVTDGTAILISTRDSERMAMGAVSGTITAHPEPDELLPQVYVNCDPVTAGNDGTYLVDDAWIGDRMARVSLDGYETQSFPVTVTEGNESTVNFEIWRLDPPSFLYITVFDEEFLSWDIPESMEEGTDHFVEYIVYRNDEELGRATNRTFEVTHIAGELNVYYVKTVYHGGISEPSNVVEVDLTPVGTEYGVAVRVPSVPCLSQSLQCNDHH